MPGLASPLCCPPCTVSPIEAAVLRTAAYADVFDYPLTLDEIHRYLIGTTTTRAELQSVLASTDRGEVGLARRGDFFTLPGREHLVELRRRRAAMARRLWPRAIDYGHAIARLPFVRMVAVTGALAMDNVEDDADIDYLIVTEPGRLWLCRALVIGLVRLAARRGDILCPNYFLSTRALVLSDRNLFTAHELAQMTPISGASLYRHMRQLNRWTEDFLPNALGPPRSPAPPASDPSTVQALAEGVLRSPLGSWFEHWEMQRKMRRFHQQRNGNLEAAFCADWCKGHFQRHGSRTLRAYEERLQALAQKGAMYGA